MTELDGLSSLMGKRFPKLGLHVHRDGAVDIVTSERVVSLGTELW
jgi:hypothetical protein